MFTAIDPQTLDPVIVGPGCTRRDLPATPGLRAWVVEIAPGAEWPHVDQHDLAGEQIVVLEGELIEGERRFGPGTYVNFAAHSSHQPRSDSGARLFGVNRISAWQNGRESPPARSYFPSRDGG